MISKEKTEISFSVMKMRLVDCVKKSKGRTLIVYTYKMKVQVLTVLY